MTTSMLDRAMGALYGVFCGDAAGAVLEFLRGPLTAEQVDKAMSLPGGGVWKVGPGQITDDGEMAMALLDSLVAGAGDMNVVAFKYVAWFLSDPFDCGMTIRRAVTPFLDNSDVQEPARQMREHARGSMDSKANGTLMRCAPIAVYGALKGMTAGHIADLAIADASLTHPNTTCLHATAAYCVAVAWLIRHAGDAEGAFGAAADWANASACQEVRDLLQLAREADDYTEPCTHFAGHLKHGFLLAFLHLRRRSDFTAALKDTLIRGGDTDTNACIVGGMLGALWGEPGIPKRMVDQVLGQTGGIPRPGWMHPRRARDLVLELQKKEGEEAAEGS